MKHVLPVSVATAFLVVAGLDRLIADWLREDSDTLTSAVKRAPNVFVFEHSPERLPAPRPGRSVVLIGNSHTYALPALEPGLPLRPDPGVTLIDTLAKEVGGDATFYRLSYPNFLPFEMLTRVAHLYHHGYRPDVVVLGLTWRNVARDAELRPQIQRVFREPGFADAFRQMITSEELRTRIEAEERAIAKELEEERMRSGADQLDRTISKAVGKYVTLIGKSRALRVRVYRELNNAITDRFVGTKETYAYDVVPADLAFNRLCLDTLLELLAARGARVIIYQAPERTDLPPLMDPGPQAEVARSIQKKAESFGFAFVDARGVVENRYWGWAWDSPDRSHFTEPGHEALGRFLAQSAPKIWETVR